MKFAMKKLITGSALVYPLVLPNIVAANSFDDAIKNAITSGQLRLAYISVAPDVAGAKTTTAFAAGGQIKFETAKWNRLQFAVAPYFSEKIDALSGDKAAGELNGDFFDSNSESYAYLGEAYVNYTFNKGSVRFGRQKLDTPFINTDNIRMLPHTYEATWLTYRPMESLLLQGGIAKKWAGFASGGNPGKFKRVTDDGATALGAIYQMKAHHTFQGWYYNFDNNYSQLYFDAIYNHGKFEAGMQYSDYNEDNASGTEGNAWGLMASYDFGAVKLSAAINESANANGKSVSIGLCGCGSYFTSMDETNIAGKNDASAYMLAIGYQITEPLVLTAAYGHFEDGNKTSSDIDEMNVIIAYTMNDSIDLEFVHTVVDNKAAPPDADTNFSRNFARMNYNF